MYIYFLLYIWLQKINFLKFKYIKKFSKNIYKFGEKMEKKKKILCKFLNIKIIKIFVIDNKFSCRLKFISLFFIKFVLIINFNIG